MESNDGMKNLEFLIFNRSGGCLFHADLKHGLVLSNPQETNDQGIVDPVAVKEYKASQDK